MSGSAEVVVLVTGAGGVYGDATVANLRRAALPLRIIGADTDWHAAGSLSSDLPVVLPPVADPGYAAALVRVVKGAGVQAVFICSGTEIKALVGERERLERETGALFVLPSAELYRVAADKLDTVDFLAGNGFDHPATISSKSAAAFDAFIGRVGFPLIAKPRLGQGSRGLATCRERADLVAIAALEEEYVFQELLGSDDHEYTVGVVATEDGDVLGLIVLRRWLRGGQTGACEVTPSAEIATYAEALARALRPRGYVNIQLRLRDSRPVAFEINARVSSSTGFRALAGFNEPELILRKYVLGEQPPRPTVTPLAMVRGLAERIVDPAIWNEALPR